MNPDARIRLLRASMPAGVSLSVWASQTSFSDGMLVRSAEQAAVGHSGGDDVQHLQILSTGSFSRPASVIRDQAMLIPSSCRNVPATPSAPSS